VNQPGKSTEGSGRRQRYANGLPYLSLVNASVPLLHITRSTAKPTGSNPRARPTGSASYGAVPISDWVAPLPEAIVTRDAASARAFQTEVAAACVYVNASTRFTDGGAFGMGAEIGNSTQKPHARGPIGLRGVCTVK